MAHVAATRAGRLCACHRDYIYRQFADIAFSHLGLDADDHIYVSEDLLRPAEVEHLIGDPTKAREKLGWEPSVSFEQLVQIMVDADMELVEIELEHARIMAERRGA